MKTRFRKHFRYFYSAFLWLLALVIIGTGILAFHYNTESEKLRADLQNIQTEKQIVKQDLLDNYQEIRNNLNRIEIHRQNIRSEFLNLTDSEGHKTPEERIREKIRKIEKLTERNNLLMANLRKNLEGRGEALENYDKKIAIVNRVIERYCSKSD